MGALLQGAWQVQAGTARQAAEDAGQGRGRRQGCQPSPGEGAGKAGPLGAGWKGFEVAGLPKPPKAMAMAGCRVGSAAGCCRKPFMEGPFCPKKEGLSVESAVGDICMPSGPLCRPQQSHAPLSQRTPGTRLVRPHAQAGHAHWSLQLGRLEQAQKPKYQAELLNLGKAARRQSTVAQTGPCTCSCSCNRTPTHGKVCSMLRSQEAYPGS